MKLPHFTALSPVCPSCRGDGPGAPLRLAEVWRSTAEDVIEGVLHCTNLTCQREHPIVDGVAMIVPDLRSLLGAEGLSILLREDLSDPLASLLGDALGPTSALDRERQRESVYVASHWDHDGRAGGAASVMKAALEAMGSPGVAGPSLELGAGPGRGALTLAEQGEGLVLGVDLDFRALRTGLRLLRTGQASYLRRKVGLVYARRPLTLDTPAADRVDLWMADVLALPFAPGSFARIAAMNLLDSCASPWGLLHAIASALRPGGLGAVASPYDWASSATVPGAWLGGHSQRSVDAGRSEPALRACLTPGSARSVPGLRLLAEVDDVPWRLSMHERSAVEYRLHMVTFARDADA